MYSLAQLRRGLSSPNLFFREANRLVHRRANRWKYNVKGVDVIAEEWDNLVILDPCRYDAFAQVHSLNGSLEFRISHGSSTFEFLRGNVAGRNLDDTVYVTANPQFYRKRERLDATFHDVINIWAEDGWDEET